MISVVGYSLNFSIAENRILVLVFMIFNQSDCFLNFKYDTVRIF